MVQVIQLQLFLVVRATFILRVHIVGGIGGFAGGSIFGVGIATILSSLVTVSARHGGHLSFWVVCGGCFSPHKSLYVQPFLRMVTISSNWSKVVSLRWCVMRPLSPSANLPSAEVTLSSGVTPWLVMYLCLWKTVD